MATGQTSDAEGSQIGALPLSSTSASPLQFRSPAVRDAATRHGPADRDKVAITEPVPLYLVQDAGLDNVTPAKFSEAVEEGNDPPAAVLNQTLELFTTKTVKVLLPNAQTESASTKQVEQAATAAGVPVVPVTETLPTGTDDYVTWQSGQIDQLSTALGTPAS
jgi:zinc/manganese transport system substrate-binding protein